jgi:hypothetical protein
VVFLATPRFRASATLLAPDTDHAFPEPAFVDKIALQPPDLLIQEVVRLVDETDGNVGDDLGRTSVAEVAVIRIRLRREAPNKQRFPAVFVPESILS